MASRAERPYVFLTQPVVFQLYMLLVASSWHQFINMKRNLFIIISLLQLIIGCKSPHHDFKFSYKIKEETKFNEVLNYLKTETADSVVKVSNSLRWHKLKGSIQRENDRIEISLDKNRVSINWANDKDLNDDEYLKKLRAIKQNLIKILNS